MLDVNDLNVGDILVLNEDSLSKGTGKVYLKGTEAKVVSTTKKGRSLSGVTLRYSDGMGVKVSGVGDLLKLVAHPFHKKTEHNIELKMGDVFKMEETLLIQHCGVTVWVDAVEVKITGLQRGNCNYHITDVDGDVWLYSKHLSKFIKEIAVKNVKLRNEEKKEVKRIDIYSDRKTLQLGDVVVSTGTGVECCKTKGGIYGIVVEHLEKDNKFVIQFEEGILEVSDTLTQLVVGNIWMSFNLFKIVTHRNVPEDFIPYEEVEEVAYAITEDKCGLVGKNYFIQCDTGYQEVICTESTISPNCINAKTFANLHYWSMDRLHEKKTVLKSIPLAPTATVNL